MGKKNWFKSIWEDESNNASSKRILGTICILSLVYVLIKEIKPDPAVVSAIEYIAIACIVATSADKAAKFISSYRKSKKDGNDDEG